MAVTIPERFRGRARRDAAAFYLAQLARGILGGEIVATAGEQQTVVVTSEFVVLEIEVKQKKRINQVSMKVRWPRCPVIRAAVGAVRMGGHSQLEFEGVAPPRFAPPDPVQSAGTKRWPPPAVTT